MNSPFPNRNRPLSATIINTTIEVARFFSVIIMFTLPDSLPLRFGAAEPVLETSRADARVIAGGEALIVQLYAEVKCVDVCGHLPCVSVCTQESSYEFVETYRFGTRQLDRAVERLSDCDVSHGGRDIIRHDGLQKGRWQANHLP